MQWELLAIGGGFIYPDPWQGAAGLPRLWSRSRLLYHYWEHQPIHELTFTEHLLCTRGSDSCSSEEFRPREVDTSGAPIFIEGEMGSENPSNFPQISRQQMGWPRGQQLVLEAPGHGGTCSCQWARARLSNMSPLTGTVGREDQIITTRRLQLFWVILTYKLCLLV